MARILGGARSRRSRSASSTPTPTGEHEQRDARDPRARSCRASTSPPRARCCPRSSSTSASRPPSPTPCCSPLVGGYVRGSAERLRARGYERRPAAAALRRRRDDAADGRAARGAPGRVRHRRGRDRERATSPRCAASTNAIGLDMGGTSTDISLVYDGEATVTKEWSSSSAIRSSSRASRCSRSAPAAARWPGSTRPARCATARRPPAPIPGPACYGRGGDGADEHRRQPRARPARHAS